jgi:hypothetical protein
VADLEFKLENLTEDEELISNWRGRVIDMIERIDHFEKQYLQKYMKILDQSPKILSKSDLSLTTPTPIYDGDLLTGSKSATRINPATH